MQIVLKDVLELLDCFDSIYVMDNDGREYAQDDVLDSQVVSIQPVFTRSIAVIVEAG